MNKYSPRELLFTDEQCFLSILQVNVPTRRTFLGEDRQKNIELTSSIKHTRNAAP